MQLFVCLGRSSLIPPSIAVLKPNSSIAPLVGRGLAVVSFAVALAGG